MVNILKFGGTSVGSAENMRRVAGIVRSEEARIVVLSAMSGVTDTLIKLSHAAGERDKEQCKQLIFTLADRYTECITNLLKNKVAAMARRKQTLEIIAREAINYRAPHSERIILSQGELLTSAIFAMHLKECGMKAELLHAPDFMVTDRSGQIDTALLETRLTRLAADPDTCYVTQGFICTDANGRIDNLGRGGSDFSAALIGVALGASQVQIWTDIDGMHNNDPRIVTDTRPIRRMSFDEAAELAYFGAKILHPSTIQPCKDHNIPVLLKNTMDPTAEGTRISNQESRQEGFHAVAAKDGIISIRICSTRMLMAYGFLRKVFEVFEQHKTPIDMITTSEVAVSLTIDNETNLRQIEMQLHDFGTIEVERNNTIVCIVGQIGHEQTGMAEQVFRALHDVPVKMISYGASHRSLSILVDTKYKKQTLQNLNDGLFDAE